MSLCSSNQDLNFFPFSCPSLTFPWCSSNFPSWVSLLLCFVSDYLESLIIVVFDSVVLAKPMYLDVVFFEFILNLDLVGLNKSWI